MYHHSQKEFATSILGNIREVRPMKLSWLLTRPVFLFQLQVSFTALATHIRSHKCQTLDVFLENNIQRKHGEGYMGSKCFKGKKEQTIPKRLPTTHMLREEWEAWFVVDTICPSDKHFEVTYRAQFQNLMSVSNSNWIQPSGWRALDQKLQYNQSSRMPCQGFESEP